MASESSASRAPDSTHAFDLGGHGVSAFGRFGGGLRNGFEYAGEVRSVRAVHGDWTARREARAGSSRTVQGKVGGGFSGSGMGLKVRPVSEGKGRRVPDRRREALPREGFGEGKGFGRESFENWVEGPFVGRRDDRRVWLGVAAEIVTESRPPISLIAASVW